MFWSEFKGMKTSATVALAFAVMFSGSLAAGWAREFHARKGQDIQRTGLIPRYPATRNCSPLTSLYASWDDVDGSKRDEPHSGVDGGRLNEEILAPADGVVLAAWRANWGWGEEGALLIRHSSKDLALTEGPKYYYSEFDHLNYSELHDIPEGKIVKRGERLASVWRPGGKPRYLPEVHWEVWEIADDTETTWSINRYKGRFWQNPTARLIDPLFLLAQQTPVAQDGSVDVPVFVEAASAGPFRGFTYILPCPPK